MDTINQFVDLYNRLERLIHVNIYTWMNSKGASLVLKPWHCPLAITAGAIGFAIVFLAFNFEDSFTFFDFDLIDLFFAVIPVIFGLFQGFIAYAVVLLFFGTGGKPTTHAQHIEQERITAVAKEYPYATTVNNQTLLTKEKPQLQLNQQISGISITGNNRLKAQQTTQMISQYGKTESTKTYLTNKVNKLNKGE